jgi:O-methyltransferase
MKKLIRKLYIRCIRSHVSNPLYQQRIKLLWFIWGYWPILLLKNTSFTKRLILLRRFLLVDWHVLHAHRPCEISRIAQVIAERPSRNGELMVEAGCYRGGSSAKFSLLCRTFGYRLHIYDSFQGVEELSPEIRTKEYDFSGQYAAGESKVLENLEHYGDISVCLIHKGWFCDTIARNAVPVPVRVVYIDCDNAKGTSEVLTGTVPSLVSDGCIFSQDYHIRSVRELLENESTWMRLGKSLPACKPLCGNLASFRFVGGTSTSTSWRLPALGNSGPVI